MRQSKEPSPPSLIRNINVSSAVRSDANEKAALGFRSQFRRTSDPRFDKPLTLAGGSGNLQSISRFPKLVFGWKTAKKAHGVVNLNTACERKYRSWSDPTEYTQAKDIWSQSGTFSRDFNTTRPFLPRLGREMNETSDNFEEKSFCDTVSSFPCSSITRTSMCSPVITDEREMCISKHKSVMNWIQSTKRTSY